MPDDWPAVSEQARTLFRRGAEVVLADPEVLVAQISEATLAGVRSRTAVADVGIVEATSIGTATNLRTWATANVRSPAERVVPELGPEALTVARDLVRRGLDETALDAYRTAQGVASRLWMHICFGLTDDADVLKELLDVSALSITTFMNDLMDQIAEQITHDRRALTRGSHAERMAAATLILEGAPIHQSRAEAQLGYPLRGPHTAAIVWSMADAASDPSDDDATASPLPRQLEAASDALARAAGTARRLTIIASQSVLWVWLPTDADLDMAALRTDVAATPSLQVAVGRPGTAVEGFRKSHLDATTTQRLMSRTPGVQQVHRFQDVQLLDLVTSDLDKAQEFVRDTLGAFATADRQAHEVVRTYIRLGCNTSQTARELFSHRSSILRRLAQADDLLPQPLSQRVVDVGVALEILRVHGPAPPHRPAQPVRSGKSLSRNSPAGRSSTTPSSR